MELEHPNNPTQTVRRRSKETTRTTTKTTTCSLSSPNDLWHRVESNFRTLEDVSKDISSEKRVDWVRSEIVGKDVEFDTPFGKRRLTYADHTASARSLHYIENFITNNVLPFYGNTHTSDSYVGHRTTKMLYYEASLGGKQEDAIMLCGAGTTSAIKRLQEVMGISVPSIMRSRVIKSCLSNEERWVVFVGPYEHHSNLLSWRQSLGEVIEIGLIDMTSLEALPRVLQQAK